MTAPEIVSTLLKIALYAAVSGVAFHLGRRAGRQEERRATIARLRGSQWGVDRRRGHTVEDKIRARWDWGIDALVDEMEGEQ